MLDRKYNIYIYSIYLLLLAETTLITALSTKPSFSAPRQLPNPNNQHKTSLLSSPKQLNNLKLNESLHAYRTSPLSRQKTDFTITRVAYNPDIFLLRNFVTREECNTIINQYTGKMEQAETISNDNNQISRKNCSVSWLPPNGEYPIVQSLMMDSANILIQEELKQCDGTGVEDLQVLKYDVDGEFVLHHDGEPRFLTVIYYLNGVAGTW